MRSTFPRTSLVHADRRSWVTLARLVEPDYRDTEKLAALTRELVELAESQGQKPVVLNCSAVHNVASTFLTALLTLRRKLEAQGSRLVLCDLSPTVAVVLERTQLHNFFATCPDERGALILLGD
jgi:anti-anti-sigma factor